MTYWETIIGKFLYSRLAITGSPTKVETEKGVKILFGITQKFTTINGVTRKEYPLYQNNHEHLCEGLTTYQRPHLDNFPKLRDHERAYDLF